MNDKVTGKNLSHVQSILPTQTLSTVTDNNWNTAWFYSKPVSRNPATLLYRSAPHKQSWNEALNEYLKQIGVSDGNLAKQVLSVEKVAV